MSIVLDICEFQLGYLYFLHAKANIMMNGTFSKILYSDEHLILNGIFLHLPLDITSIEKVANKNIIQFHPNSTTNAPLIRELSKIENRIIEYYKQLQQSIYEPSENAVSRYRDDVSDVYMKRYKPVKKLSCLLSKQLASGKLKLYRDYSEQRTTKGKTPYYMIKISGVWENEIEIGITYKIIEAFTE